MEGIDSLATKVRSVTARRAAKPKIAASKQEPALLSLILKQLDDDKAEDTTPIDVRGRTSIADHMVVTSGRSNRHVAAIAEHLIEALSRAGHKPRFAGLPAADWVAIDAGDIIVHVFRPEVREFYSLERMWQSRNAAKA
ncbi:MAG: ribosome silencing factor [Xanthobacteraceae bacterium]|jgi:ribosome-associated protein|nr:ribosome silencing factor [Xanthobacteraceae bacterium]